MLHSLQSGWAWNWTASEQGGFVLAVLVLALILIFWLFASPPAQASAGTNFSASPLMQ
ncbi:hypothetical protein [Methyloceanibacter sp.]|jgi:hypothetical protein|uniref:hypothetical protein n=1 Tax=Methyloceanibacter sp. TaxID=1965321 RepID=UPI00351B2B6D